jgi:hypothetical protein
MITPKRTNELIIMGWHVMKLEQELHFWHSREGASLAVSHCGLIYPTKNLTSLDGGIYCSFCDTIEQSHISREVPGK